MMYALGCASPVQERWENELAVMEASRQPDQGQTDEALVKAELQRLSAADIVLVPYPVLSREVLHTCPYHASRDVTNIANARALQMPAFSRPRQHCLASATAEQPLL